jgi:DNA-binding IclR family transcriptional regulator
LTLLGYLTHDSVLQKYRLGPGVLSLGHPLLASMQVRQLAKPMMEALARKTRCAVNLGMRDRASVVYIDSVRADRANTHLPDIGTSRPLLASAMGRALVMACPADERAAIVNYLKVHDRKQFAAHHASFEENRKLFAREGYCLSLGEWREEIHAVAVPVARRRGEAGLAINCSLYSHRAAGDKLVRVVVPLLKDAVRELETALGIR